MTWIVVLYLGTVVGVAGPFPMTMQECRELADEPAMRYLVPNGGYAPKDITLDCSREPVIVGTSR